MSKSDRIQCISPVDGRIYAERPIASGDAVKQAFAKARHAQKAWKLQSIEERAVYCGQAVDAMQSMAEDIVPELA